MNLPTNPSPPELLSPPARPELQPADTTIKPEPPRYPIYPYWGGKPRLPTIPSFIYDQSPEPINLYDVKAKLGHLHWEVEDIQMQLREETALAILEDRFAGNQEEWLRWKQQTQSCERIKRTQIFIYFNWLKTTEREQLLADSPITEAMKIADKALGKVGGLQQEVKDLRQMVKDLQKVINEIVGIKDQVEPAQPHELYFEP